MHIQLENKSDVPASQVVHMTHNNFYSEIVAEFRYRSQIIV